MPVKTVQPPVAKDKLLAGALRNYSAAGYTMEVDGATPAPLEEVYGAVLARVKAAVLVGASGVRPDDPASVEGIFAARLAKMRPDVQLQIKQRALELMGLPLEQRQAELGYLADLQIGTVKSLTGSGLPAAVRSKVGDLARLAATSDPQSPPPALGKGTLPKKPSKKVSALVTAATPVIDFQLDALRCDNPTSGPGDDEILLGGTIVLPDGKTVTFNRGKIADSMNTGRAVTFSPPLVVHSFPTPLDNFIPWPDGPGSMHFAVVLYLGEEDNGGFGDFIAGATVAIGVLVAALVAEAIVDATIPGAIVLAFVLGRLVREIFSWVRDWWNDDLIATHAFRMHLYRPLVSFGDGSQVERQQTIFAGSGGQYTLDWSWRVRVNGLVDNFKAGPFEVVKMVKESPAEGHPHTEIVLPDGFKVIGGGAWVNYGGAGSLLTAAYPSSDTTWAVAAKDHELPDPATVTAVAFGARQIDGRVIPPEMYRITRGTSAPSQQPATSIPLPDDFALVGGGAKVNAGEPGSLLTASYPQGNGWAAAAKDHGLPCTATVDAYAIGVSKQIVKSPPVTVTEGTAPSPVPHPNMAVVAPATARLIGGGARVNYGPPGSLLTGLRDQEQAWIVAGKDHKYPCPATITGFAMSLPSPDPLKLQKIGETTIEKSVFADNVAGWGAGNYQTIQFTLAPSVPRPAGARYILRWTEWRAQWQNVTRWDVRGLPTNDFDHVDVIITVKGENWWGTTGRCRVVYTIWWELLPG